MASAPFAPDFFSRHRFPFAEIDAVVSARLGPTRRLGNSQPACFNRQVAMYLAKHVGRWTVAIISGFYDGRDHSTVCYSIQRIEALRESDPQVDALLTDLKHQLVHEDSAASASVASDERYCPTGQSQADLENFAELIAARVCAYIEKRTRTPQQDAQTGQTYE
jgi:Bacterial dnaA protein helix-turn-helix